MDLEPGSEPFTSFQKFIDVCKVGSESGKCYEVKCTNARVDIGHMTMLQTCLRELLPQDTSTRFPDHIMDQRSREERRRRKAFAP